MQRKFSSGRHIVVSARLLLALIGAAMPLTVHAASATLTTDSALHAERYVDAKVLSRLEKGTSVETLQSEAGWVQVRAGAHVGWLRASQLSGIDAPPAKPVQDGRNGPDNVMAISGIRSMPRASSQSGTALSTVHEQRDATHAVSVTLRHSTLSIGKDNLDFSVTSSHDGYLYLILLGSDNKSLYMLFPNDLDQDNTIQAGKALQLPRKTWEIKAQGPSGTDKMLAVVTESPRNLRDLGANKAGPFLGMPSDTEGRPNLQWLLRTSAGDCRHDEHVSKRGIAQTCSDAFGSALIDIVER